MHSVHAERVLGGQCRNRHQRVAARGDNRLAVRLNAGRATRVAAGDGEHARCGIERIQQSTHGLSRVHSLGKLAHGGDPTYPQRGGSAHALRVEATQREPRDRRLVHRSHGGREPGGFPIGLRGCSPERADGGVVRTFGGGLRERLAAPAGATDDGLGPHDRPRPGERAIVLPEVYAVCTDQGRELRIVVDDQQGTRVAGGSGAGAAGGDQPLTIERAVAQLEDGGTGRGAAGNRLRQRARAQRCRTDHVELRVLEDAQALGPRPHAAVPGPRSGRPASGVEALA